MKRRHPKIFQKNIRIPFVGWLCISLQLFCRHDWEETYIGPIKMTHNLFWVCNKCGALIPRRKGDKKPK